MRSKVVAGSIYFYYDKHTPDKILVPGFWSMIPIFSYIGFPLLYLAIIKSIDFYMMRRRRYYELLEEVKERNKKVMTMYELISDEELNS